MQTILITKIDINLSGSLRIFPENKSYTMIYRSATEVHWDNTEKCLYSPKPREWSYMDWYKHIILVIKTECSQVLEITPETKFTNIPSELIKAISEYRAFMDAGN